MSHVTQDQLVSLCKRRGFVYPTSEIYGGLISSYDYGPLGAALIRNIRNLWWQTFIEKRADMVGLDSQIILHPRTWEASGHVSNFNEPLVEDKVTNKRYRADHLVEAWLKVHPDVEQIVVENLNFSELNDFISKNNIKSPQGNDLSSIKKFNQLFKTSIGVVEDSKSEVYLRGETAQGIFSNFKNILDSSRVRLPFGVGQIGKSFRNEITTGQFVFRTLEFEQAEIEYFFDPSSKNWQDLMESWKNAMWNFVVHELGINSDSLRWRRHTDTERSHYSLDTYDLDYNFPFGWKELWGIAYRTDYDLKQHIEFSKVDLSYTDPTTGKTFVPHVIEPAVGINRLVFMAIANAYHDDGKRLVLKLKPSLSPFKAAVFPLVSNKPELVTKARTIFENLLNLFPTVWDDRGNIGKRYYSQDEIGTPFCITVDHESLSDDAVTVRDRDTATQERINISQLDSYLALKLK